MLRTLPLPLGSEGVVRWDGRDDDGRHVRAGIYFVRLRGGGKEAIGRIVLLE